MTVLVRATRAMWLSGHPQHHVHPVKVNGSHLYNAKAVQCNAKAIVLGCNISFKLRLQHSRRYTHAACAPCSPVQQRARAAPLTVYAAVAAQE